MLRSVVIVAVCAGGMAAANGQSAGVMGGSVGTPAPAQTAQPRMARISSGVMQGQILTKVAPVYPADARMNGIQGTVVLHAIIGKDGRIEKLDVISGPDELRAAAADAVSQWTYRPYLLNGEPTEVDTTVIINFNLAPN